MNMGDLKLSDLREEHRMAAEVIGLEAYMELCRAFGGAAICIPTHYNLYKNYYRRMILADRGKHSNKELAKMYPVSLSTICGIRKNADESTVKDAPDGFSVRDLEPHLRDMADLIGFEKIQALCVAYEAVPLYIPTEKEVTRKYIERKILENRDFFSKKELARIYNVSLATVYNVLRKQGE